MFKIWCICRDMGALTNIISSKVTEKLAMQEFNTFYSRKYEFKKIVPCTRRKCAV